MPSETGGSGVAGFSGLVHLRMPSVCHATGRILLRQARLKNAAGCDCQCQDLFLAFFNLRCCLSACDVGNMVQCCSA